MGNTTNINLGDVSGGQLSFGNNSTNINIEQIPQLTEEIEKLPSDGKGSFSDNMKELLVDELKGLAKGEIKQLSKDTLAALKSKIVELSAGAAAVASSLIGS